MTKMSAMRIKSYFGGSVDKAMAEARAELGSDALLLNTRRRTENGKPTGYEIVMGVPETRTASPSPSAPSGALADELIKLREQMDEIQSLLVRSAKDQLLGSRSAPELGDLHARLLSSHVDPVLSKDIVDRVEARIATDAFLESGPSANGTYNQRKAFRPNPSLLVDFLRAEWAHRVNIRPYCGFEEGSHGPVSVVVGPTGSGKTTSLAKLAVATGAQGAVRLLSLDDSRPGAARQLQTLAKGSNISFSLVEVLDRLPEMIADARTRECVFIDTPGFGGVHQRAAETCAAVLAQCPEIDVHVVVPAYMSAVDMRHAIERYRIFSPSKLLVTKLDEAQTLGPAVSEAARSGLALSFLTDGPRVPDDIRAATTEDLLVLDLKRPRARAQSAA